MYDDIKTNGLKGIWKNAYAFIYMRLRFLSFLLLTQIFCLRNLCNAQFCSLDLYFCFQSPYFELYFCFFNGQYATVCIFHKLTPRETHACGETQNLISFKKEFQWQKPKCKYAYTGTKQCTFCTYCTWRTNIS